MCFSAPASFVAGSVLSAAGIATLAKPKKKKEIPLALIPLLFGIQQLIEGFVWLSFRWGMPGFNVITTYTFVFLAHVFWPIFVPIAVALVEPKIWRKKMIMICGVLGAMIGLYFLSLIMLYPVSSHIVNDSIQYDFLVPHVPFIVQAIFYIAATCLASLLSSHRMIRLLGISTLASLIIAYYFYTVTFASVWCFFAAILSLIIYLYFRQGKTVKIK